MLKYNRNRDLKNRQNKIKLQCLLRHFTKDTQIYPVNIKQIIKLLQIHKIQNLNILENIPV